MLQQLRGIKPRRVVPDSEGGRCEQANMPAAVDAELTEFEVSFTSQGRAADAFLVILIHEARHLVAKDYDTHSSDPFVKVSLGACTKKTRVVYRNCHPLWEQRLVFPISGVPEGEPLLIELFDKDFRTKEFLGQVVMTLGKALEIAADPAMGQQYWLSVSKQRSSDVVGGELCVGFQVIDAVMYASLIEELDSQLDAEQITTSLAGKALHVQLKGLNGLGASGLLRKSSTGSTPTKLSLFIKYGRLTMEKHLPPLPTLDEADTLATDYAGFELPVNEEVVIPLEAALRTAPLASRRRDELYDVKLYIKSTVSNTTVAKTQIPIWSIPTHDKKSTADATAGHANVDAATAGGSSQPETPRSVQDGTLGTCRTSGDKAASVSASAGSVLHGSDVSGEFAGSCCSTPRTAGGSCTGDFCLAAFRGDHTAISPRAALNQTGLAEDVMRRSKSDVVSLLGASCPHSLSQLSGISLGGSSSKNGFSEGSLYSVTSSRVQNPAAPTAFGRRKVQNLEDLYDVRTALRSKLAPCKEITRMGWAPTKTQCDEGGVQAVDSTCKHYYRIMEGCIPMYTNLEIGLGLELVPQVQQTEAYVSCTQVQDGDLTVDYSDDEECLEATPISLPDPYDLVLQDCTVQTGVNSLHQLLLGSNSKLMAEHYASEGLMDVEIGPWQLGVSGGEFLRYRHVSYTKKLNIPVPLAPKQCQVWEEHRLLVKQDGGFVAQHMCTNNAPKGDCFQALIQICGVYISSGSSRLRVSMKLDWHKNILGKSMVQIGAEADSKRGWGNLIRLLQQHISNRASESDTKCQLTVAATSRAKEAATSSADNASSVGPVKPDTAGWASKRSLIVVGRLLLLLAVLALAILLVMGIYGVRDELRELKRAMIALADAAASTSNATCFDK